MSAHSTITERTKAYPTMAHLHCQMCGLEKRVSSKFEGVVVKCPNCGDKVLVGSSELSASNEPEDTESTTGEVWNGEPPLLSRSSPTRERNRNAIIYAISGTLVLGSFYAPGSGYCRAGGAIAPSLGFSVAPLESAPNTFHSPPPSEILRPSNQLVVMS